MRALFYSWMVHAKDLETQRKGTVSVVYAIRTANKRTQKDKGNMWVSVPKVMRAIPLRCEAFHLCLDSLLWETVFSFFRISMNLSMQMRTRSHRGKFLYAVAALAVSLKADHLLCFRFLQDHELNVCTSS